MIIICVGTSEGEGLLYGTFAERPMFIEVFLTD